MKQLTLLVAACLITLTSFASGNDSIRYWKTKYESAVGLTQTSFTQWMKGGENAVSVKGMLNLFQDYSKGKFTWNNYLGASYMVQKLQSYSKWRKADDKINIFTKAGLYAWNKWDYTALLEFKSQFAKGYNYPNDSDYTSRFLAPGYFQLALGLSYKPVDYFSVLISPVGARLTVVNDTKLSNAGAYGVDSSKTTLFQAGASINAILKKDIFKNISLMSKLDLFSDYLGDPQVVINWENNVLMKVNKYISVNLATMLIHDNKIPYIDPKDEKKTPHGARVQFMETVTVGFAFGFTR